LQRGTVPIFSSINRQKRQFLSTYKIADGDSPCGKAAWRLVAGNFFRGLQIALDNDKSEKRTMPRVMLFAPMHVENMIEYQHPN